MDDLCSQVVETTPAGGRQLSQTLSLQTADKHDDDGGTGQRQPSVAFTVSVEPPRRAACVLAVHAGQFQTCTMPENIEQLWGPISLPRLPDGVPNNCIVASHRCTQTLR